MWMARTSKPGTLEHKTGVKNLSEAIKASHDFFLEDEQIRHYRGDEEEIVNLMFELCEQRGLLSSSKKEDFCTWILVQRGHAFEMKEDYWILRLEGMVKSVLDGDYLNDSHVAHFFKEAILSDLWAMVSRGSDNGKFADTDWPLRMASMLYDPSENPENRYFDFAKIISIRNACQEGADSEKWFMAAVLCEAIEKERREGPLRAPTTLELFHGLKTIDLRPYFFMSGPRKFEVSKSFKDAVPLWEMALRTLGASEACLSSLSIAIHSLSVDFSQKENFDLAIKTIADETIVEPPRSVDLTDVIDHDYLGFVK